MVIEEIRIGMRVKVLPSGLEGRVNERYDEPDGPRFIIVFYDEEPDDHRCRCDCSECCPYSESYYYDDDTIPVCYSARPEELAAV